MYQRRLCPSVGAILRPLTQDTAALPGCDIRAFHISARRCEENGSSSPSAPRPQNPIETRRTRSRAAVGQVLSLGSKPDSTTTSAASPQAPRRLLVRRELVDGVNPNAPQRRTPPPPGKMVRAPSQLRITRNAGGPRPKGPDLGGRERSQGPGNSAGREEPKKRQRAAGAAAGPAKQDAEPRVEDTLSDGMVQQLLRLQRQEWDRKKYQPKYAHGSKEAQELIEAGKKLFEGEVPKVKEYSKLERRMGILGMHGI